MGRCYEEDEDRCQRSRRKCRVGVPKGNRAPSNVTSEDRRQRAACDAPPDKLHQPKEADQVIEKLVAADPENYRVYLARGRYHLTLAARDPSQKSLLSIAKKDFETAKLKEPAEPEVYLELEQAISNEWKSKTTR